LSITSSKLSIPWIEVLAKHAGEGKFTNLESLEISLSYHEMVKEASDPDKHGTYESLPKDSQQVEEGETTHAEKFEGLFMM